MTISLAKICKDRGFHQMPSSVVVLGHKYKLVCMDASGWSDSLGQMRTDDGQILFSSAIKTRAMLAEVILHEVCHAIIYHMSVDEPATEEQYVAALGTGLMCFVRDNPVLLRWLGKMSK